MVNTPIKFKVFAVTGYDEKFEKPLTTAVETGMEKADIKTTVYKIDEELSNHYKEINSDDKSSEKSSKDSKALLQSDNMQDYLASSLEKSFHKDIPVKKRKNFMLSN
ncbi:hypothetical protein [Lactobacillus sp. PV012]|uniref:hypothetical protein n=1 Tax=Lactobacillus sp. PV012 TaxID=2594494 RepID=UPI0022401CD1|nr:hypothetical protein [Lactobacillus sp. PV012]QNQ82223.1 hypothetical protein FP433_03815 [Lactobacillus sp. PV012]